MAIASMLLLPATTAAAMALRSAQTESG